MAEKETGRVEAFSDGVFAIAITLLILEIKVPKLSHDSPPAALAKALFDLWPSYFASCSASLPSSSCGSITTACSIWFGA